MGQVKILKRSEDLTPTSVAKSSGQGLVDDVLVLCSTDRLGPEPEMVQKQIKVSDLKVFGFPAAEFASNSGLLRLPLNNFLCCQAPLHSLPFIWLLLPHN